ELGGGASMGQVSGRLGLGHGLEASLSGYKVFSGHLCGAQCAGRLGLKYSTDRPEEEGLQKYTIAGEVGFGVGGGFACTGTPADPTHATCSPRNLYYGSDFGGIINFSPHDSISPYLALGEQIVTQPQEDNSLAFSAWTRGAAGLEFNAGRMQVNVE